MVEAAPEVLRQHLTQRFDATHRLAQERDPGAGFVRREAVQRLQTGDLEEVASRALEGLEARSRDLLFDIPRGGPLRSLWNLGKRLVRRLGKHYLLRQTETNEQSALALRAVFEMLRRRDEERRVALERLGHELAALRAELAGHPPRDPGELTAELEARHVAPLRAAIAERDGWIRSLDERIGTLGTALETALAERDAWLAALRDEHRSWLETHERTLTDHGTWLAELGRSGQDHAAWLERIEGERGADHGWLEAIRDETRDIKPWLAKIADEAQAERRAHADQAAERGRWLESLERRATDHAGWLEGQGKLIQEVRADVERVAREAARSASVAAFVAEPEDTWLMATRRDGGAPGAPAPAASARESETPERRQANDPTARVEAPARTSVLEDLSDLRPAGKVRGELERIRDVLSSARRVVDLGCGHGYALAWLREQGIAAVGVDADAAAVDACRAAGLDAHVGWLPEALDEVLDGTTDTVLCLHLIEHLEPAPASALLDAIGARLPPGGRLILATPNPRSLVTQLVHFWQDPDHRRFYPAELLETWLARAGLDTERL